MMPLFRPSKDGRTNPKRTIVTHRPDDTELLPDKDAKGEDETAPAAKGRHPTREDVPGGRQR